MKIEKKGKTREEFLEEFPEMLGWVEKMEEFYGRFHHCGNILLSGGRILLVAHFERIWHCNFINPENPKGRDSITFNLSPEGMCAMIGLFDVLSTKEQRATDFENLIISMQKADAERANITEDEREHANSN